MVLQFSGGSSAAPMKEGSAGIGQKEYAGMAFEVTEKSSIEVKSVTFCNDPDGGLDVSRATTVESGNSNDVMPSHPDTCQAGTDQVVEWYCDASNVARYNFIDCDFGCCDGACLAQGVMCGGAYAAREDVKLTKPTLSIGTFCTDTDKENSKYIQGTVTLGSETVVDTCTPFTNNAGSRGTIEYFCDSSTSYSTITGTVASTCQDSQNCEDGICKYRTCTDTDGGVSVLKKGTVDVTGMTPTSDYCVDDMHIIEYSCDSLNYLKESPLLMCGLKRHCDDGACVENDCLDTDEMGAGGGLIPGVKGVIYWMGQPLYEDGCNSATVLNEYVCDEYNKPVSTVYQCPGSQQCVDGACI